MRSCYPLLVLMAACGITTASPDVRAFEFAQGVIVDAPRAVVYVSSAQAKIDAVSLSNGEVIATSTRAGKPLLLYDDVLLAAVQDRNDTLSIVGLTTNGLKPKFEVDLSLPSGVGTGSFYTGARIAGDEIIVQWRSIRRPFTAIPTHEPAVVTTGFARIDSATGRLITAREGEPPVAPK